MTCEIIGRAIVCSTPVFEYGGYRFEFHRYSGPHPVRKDNGELFKRIPERFWDVFSEFDKISDNEKFRLT